jgi:hypothetical protein
MRPVLVAATLAVAGCSSASGSLTMDPAEAARGRVEQRIAGVWRLTSYIPESALSPAMLLGLQGEKLAVRFEDGRIRSETTGMTMDRAFRVTDAQDNRFRLFIKDDTGLEYENVCEFDEKGRIQFFTTTAPWRGRGMLEREGPAIAAAAEVY